MATYDPSSAVVQTALINGTKVSLTATPVSAATQAVTTTTANVILPYTTSVVSDEDLRIVGQYDVEVEDRATLLLKAADKSFNIGQRILVRNDERLNGFWTIWVYAPADSTADAAGLVFEDVQTYRTTDFFDVVDWYADGYSAAQPPAMSYQTIEARNLNEGPNPVNTWVRVNDDGGAWAWYAYAAETGWVLVAREGGTVRFKEAFYDPNRVVYGVDSLDAATINNRDGSWELRALYNALKTTVLSTAQINELFFSMLHFIHSQQDQVDWAFKTSFLSVIGYNEHLAQTPIQAYDTTDNLLDYIDEVKPYRVKTRDFKRILTPEVDQVNAHATDFDRPLYLDPRTNQYRRLSFTSAEDLAVVRSTYPWKDWYETYQKADHDNPASNAFNAVRSIRIKILFDRIDVNDVPLNSGGGWDIPPWDVLGWDGDETNYETAGSALARILAYYEPTLGMIEKNPEELMDGVGFRGITTDGLDLLVYPDDASEWDVRPYDTTGGDIRISKDHDNTIDGYQGGKVEVAINDDADIYGLRDPYHEKNHPEELVPVQGNEAVTLIVHTEWSVGAPNHYVTHVGTKRIRRANVRVPFHGVASTASAVMVFLDGRCGVEGRDYTVDLFGGYVDVNLPTPRPDFVMVHAFGAGGQERIIEQVFTQADGITGTYELARTPTGSIEVTVGGKVLDRGQYDVVGRSVVLHAAPAKGVSVLILSFDAPADQSPATHVTREVVAYDPSQSWALRYLTDVGSPVDHMGTIVNVDGFRLAPPITAQNIVVAARQFVEFHDVGDVKNLALWLDNVPYSEAITVIDRSDLDPQDETLPVGIYVVDRELFVNDPNAKGKILLSVLYEGHEYEIVNSILSINKPLDDTARIETVTFQNAARMGVETYVFSGNIQGIYRVPAHLDASDMCLVSLNGRYLVQGVHYEFARYRDIGWDRPEFDRLEFGGDKEAFFNISAVTIPGGQQPDDKIVAVVFKGRPADQPATWAMTSAKPSLSMMGDPKLIMEWGFAPFGSAPVEAVVPTISHSPLGDRNIYQMTDSWQTFEWESDEPNADKPIQGFVRTDIGPNDDTITVALPAYVADAATFYTEPNPDTSEPGVLMINGERIEYFAMEYFNRVYTFRELRRGTRGTRLSREQRKVAIGTGSNVRLNGGTAATTPEVRVLNPDGSHTDLLLGQHFTVVTDADALTVILSYALPLGARVVVSQTTPALHKAGDLVRDVTQTVYRRGCPFRVRSDLTDIQITTAGYAA